jgi:hypothetical protein
MISEKDTVKHLGRILKILKERFESGDKSALLYATYQCCLMKEPSAGMAAARFHRRL